MPRATQLALLIALVIAVFAAALSAQIAPPTLLTVSYEDDSGWVANDGPRREVILSFPVVFDQATSIRIHFSDVQLSGSLERGDASLLRITSLQDGYHQTLNSEHVEQWGLTSAYFNGSIVLVEVIASPGTGNNRIAIASLEVGVPPAFPESQCGPTDDRVPSSDPRVARLMPVACTAWMINDCAKCFLSAGHCGTGGSSTVQFNVPNSTGGGSLVFPPPSDQYAVDISSYQFQNGSDDWQYFGVFANSTSGLTPFQTMGSAFDLVNPPTPGGTTIRITGHGTDSTPNLTFNQIQQTHTGPMTGLGTNLNYQVDTTGGSSGSPVIWEQQNAAIGIHTNGGCSTGGGGSNSGTPITATSLQAALNDPEGRCLVADGQGLDCNNNGTDDSCDIASGASQDLNGNDIPDECEPASTFYVDNTGSCPGSGTSGDPFCTVRDAISASLTGDTIIVRDGTGLYTGVDNRNLDFGGRAITVRSENGPASVTLDAGNAFGSTLVVFASGEDSTAVLEGFTLRGGNAVGSGGGIRCVDSSPTIRNCVIIDNRASMVGGGVAVNGGSPLILNCTLADNTVGLPPFVNGLGGGLALVDCAAIVRNTTIVHNVTSDGLVFDGQGGGVFVSDSPGASIVNSIVWGNTAVLGTSIHVASGADPDVRHSNVEGGFPGVSMLAIDPAFVANGPGGDYHLQSGSPCADAGDSLAVGLGETDIDGELRIQGSAVEMGSDELRADDPWVDLGGGTAGVSGQPQLDMSGPLTTGSVITLDLTNANASALALVFVSFTSTRTPFLGGTLHSFPIDEIVVIGTDGGGGLSGSASFPGAASGSQLWFQVGIDDPSVAIFGASLSNGSVGTVP